MSDLLSKLREDGIRKFNQDNKASQKEQSAAKALQHTTLGYNYCLNQYWAIAKARSSGGKKPLNSQYVEELLTRCRRADSVINVFRASPNRIRQDETLIRVANHLNLHLFMAGSRIERVKHLMPRYFDPGPAEPRRRMTASNFRATRAGGSDASSQATTAKGGPPKTWFEGQERLEIVRLMGDMSVLTHCLLVGIAKLDIADDLGPEHQKAIEEFDPFFAFATKFGLWTTQFIDNPFADDIERQSAVLGERESMGFFSAVLYAEDTMRLARVADYITPQGRAGSSVFFSSKRAGGGGAGGAGSRIDLSSSSRPHMPVQPHREGLAEVPLGSSPETPPHGASRSAMLNRAESQTGLISKMGASFRNLGGAASKAQDDMSPNLTMLVQALTQASEWMNNIDKKEYSVDAPARAITWRLSQYTCAVQAEIAASRAPLPGLNMSWIMAKSTNNFGETLRAIKKREVKELARLAARGLHPRILEHPPHHDEHPPHHDEHPPHHDEQPGGGGDGTALAHAFDAPEPWRTYGITYLGPFGLMNISTKKLSVRTAIIDESKKGEYTIDLAFPGDASDTAGKTTFERKMEVYRRRFASAGQASLKGLLSPLSPVTVTKGDLSLPKDTDSFAWAYPLKGMTEVLAAETFAELQKAKIELDEVDFFMLNGGYVYWRRNERAQPSVIKSLFTGAPQLLFSEPQPLPAALAAEEDLFGDTTLNVLIKELHAFKFRWLTPNEVKKISPHLANSHGGFAYLYRDEHGNRKRDADNFFSLYSPPRTEASGLNKGGAVAVDDEDAVGEGAEGEIEAQINEEQYFDKREEDGDEAEDARGPDAVRTEQLVGVNAGPSA